MPNDRIRTILVEDEEIARLGLRLIVESMPGAEIVAEFNDGRSVVKEAPSLNADLVLINISLPVMDGLQTIALLKQTTSSKIIVITGEDRESDAFAALQAGADAFCLRGLGAQHFVHVIACVLGGGLWLDSKVVPTLVGRLQKKQTDPSAAAASERQLSRRELEVLALVAEGLTNQEMAARLMVSNETVKTHMRHIKDKLGVADRTQAAIKAINEGLIGRPQSAITVKRNS